MSDDPMRILVVEPTKDPYVKEIDGSLASMQAIVGGFIQAVEPFDDPNVLLLCNEEAKILGQRYSPRIYGRAERGYKREFQALKRGRCSDYSPNPRYSRG